MEATDEKLKCEDFESHKNQNIKRRKAKLLDSSVLRNSALGANSKPHKREEIMIVSASEEESWLYFVLKKTKLVALNDFFVGNTLVPHEKDSKSCYKCSLKTFIYTARNHSMKINKCKYDNPNGKSDENILGGGFLFVKASEFMVSKILKQINSYEHPALDFATKRVAQIPNYQMENFIRLYEAFPYNIQIMEHPLSVYAQQHQKVRITAGVLSGAEGYIVRVHKDRHFVFCFGNMTLGISSMHKYPFEVVE